ncbi:murein L,D-transpeptidase catalytic domain family protein [Ferruginibacter albus]|uniref:murein L,D-transpeptidase catalytic domain family protein n=1 Tax=Ferruginibacter albus TaxID=2875540 RepID=UPI001CC53F38|nr:murein L,D-transpeptidase catalytic domain family protein [Ferruginibacter albus]
MKKTHIVTIFLFALVLHIPFVFAKAKPFPKLSIKDSDISVPATANNDAVAHMQNLYDSLKLSSIGLGKEVFNYAYRGFSYLTEIGKISNDHILTIIDFTKSSAQKRLFTIDLTKMKVLFNTYVAHGQNSGEAFATKFSNLDESNKSSLGFYETADTYLGKHGCSMHLEGLEKGFNDNAYARDIVMHGADYVNEQLIRSRGYIGRSLGCPAVSPKMVRPIINKIKNGTCLFIYGNDNSYLSSSRILKQSGMQDMASNR